MYYQYVPITTKVVSSPAHNKVNLMQHYVMFVSDIWQISEFLQLFYIPPTTDCRNITEILLKVALIIHNFKPNL